MNRYGPGLVIYWHGFIRDLAQLEGGEDVLLLDRFPHPHELLTLPRLPLALGEAPEDPPALPAARGAAAAAVAVAAGGPGEAALAGHSQ